MKYQKMYSLLFNQITNTIKILEEEINKLKEVQLIAEKIYIEFDENHNEEID